MMTINSTWLDVRVAALVELDSSEVTAAARNSMVSVEITASFSRRELMIGTSLFCTFDIKSPSGHISNE